MGDFMMNAYKHHHKEKAKVGFQELSHYRGLFDKSVDLMQIGHLAMH